MGGILVQKFKIQTSNFKEDFGFEKDIGL